MRSIAVHPGARHPIGFRHVNGQLIPSNHEQSNAAFQGPMFHFPNLQTNMQNLRAGRINNFLANLPAGFRHLTR